MSFTVFLSAKTISEMATRKRAFCEPEEIQNYLDDLDSDLSSLDSPDDSESDGKYFGDFLHAFFGSV